MRALSPEVARVVLSSPVVAWLQQWWFWRWEILYRRSWRVCGISGYGDVKVLTVGLQAPSRYFAFPLKAKAVLSLFLFFCSPFL